MSSHRTTKILLLEPEFKSIYDLLAVAAEDANVISRTIAANLAQPVFGNTSHYPLELEDLSMSVESFNEQLRQASATVSEAIEAAWAEALTSLDELDFWQVEYSSLQSYAFREPDFSDRLWLSFHRFLSHSVLHESVIYATLSRVRSLWQTIVTFGPGSQELVIRRLRRLFTRKLICIRTPARVVALSVQPGIIPTTVQPCAP